MTTSVPHQKGLHKVTVDFVKQVLTKQNRPIPSTLQIAVKFTAKENPVEPCYTAKDASTNRFTRSLHDSPPIESANPIMKASVMGRLFYLVAALLRSSLWKVRRKQQP